MLSPDRPTARRLLTVALGAAALGVIVPSLPAAAAQPPARAATRPDAGVVAAPAPAPAQPAPTAAAAQAPVQPAQGAPAECAPLPAARLPLAFGPGEVLEFDLDAMGAKAGSMSMRTLPARDGLLPVEVRTESGSLFSKVKRVRGTGTSFLDPRTVRPRRYTEESYENEVHRTANVTFAQAERRVAASYTTGKSAGRREFRSGPDVFDAASAVYLLRQLPLEAGQALCTDVYGIRRMWRLTGKVEGKEHVSLPLGEFEAWRVSGVAVRLDNPKIRRELHVWISDDARRLPLAAVGSVDAGVVRATLTAVKRPGEKARKAQGKESLKW